MAENLDHLGLGDEKVHDLVRLGGDHQEIQIADGLFHPPQGPGHVGPFHFRQGPEGRQHLVGQGQDFAQQEAAGALFEKFDALQDIGLGFLAEAF